MARPQKKELDYFSFDVNFFNNKKVRKIKMACGAQGITVLINLLCTIYGDKGYYTKWDDDLPFLIADTVGVSEGAALEVIKKAVQIGFLDPDLFEKGILTSSEIQSRYSRVCKDAKRTGWEIKPEYDLTTEETEFTTEETQKPPGESTHSKEEESKVQKSTKKFTKKDFKQALISKGAKAEIVEDWLKVRESKKAVNTKTALNTFLNECENNNFPVEDAVRICTEKSWKGFKVAWLKNLENGANQNKKSEPRINRQSADTIRQNSTGWEIE
ncbi:DUF4373 domain-containing protein [Christiangramia crocea]|uniref:DUF4373 domain-containing protein n=1 Tax=Christiangramia crocea TaxID=2904124 RepID=A0A9X1UXA0_9FLAO|nr:DUF4373 domain-containing protein [Gramella crocea]MCG9971023.1 DUF4373 domain-containing protein [Gramella crocea]